jgi:pterin-4a-carbinolamine dehydratase
MANSIFISYRRADSQHATFAIADRLRWAFEPGEVFFDRGSIRAGNEWPDSLRRGLEAARVLVVVIGRTWLTIADEWGRRRIDDPGDWVRREICSGLAARENGATSVIPVLLGGAQQVRAEALDPALRALADIAPERIDDHAWEDGLERLIVAVAEAAGISRIVNRGDRNPNGSPSRPPRNFSEQKRLSDAEVRMALEQLARWQLQWGSHPWGVGGQAQEITKSYDFDSFADAIDFMAQASKEIDAWHPPHHPRWENQWKVVNVYFSTWDVDCRVTKLDIDAAAKLDRLFENRRVRPQNG